MLKRFAIAAAVATLAAALLPPSSFAKSHKAKEAACSFGQACIDKPAKVSQATGWSTVKRCSYESHKMYQDVFPCYRPGGMCPTAVCKSKK
jgi:hypothetical protein